MELTAEQLARFRRDGFLNAGPIFAAAEVDEIRAEYDRFVRSDAQTLGNDRDGRFPYRAMLNFRSPKLRRYINHPELMGVVRQLVGDDVRFWWDQGINKLPGSGSPIPWHQDNGYSPGRVPEYLTTWLALDDSDADNGGLFVIPGSHLGGQREHVAWNEHWIVPDVDASAAVPLPARAGDTLLFSTLLLHQTVGNRTENRQRRAWVMQYARADAVNEVTGDDFQDRAWVIHSGTIVAEPYSERRFDLRGNANRES